MNTPDRDDAKHTPGPQISPEPTVDSLQGELLAICRGSYAYETWARVTAQPINERTDCRSRMRGQQRVNDIRLQIYALNPNAALYFGWGPSEDQYAKEEFFEAIAKATGRNQ